MSPSLACSAGYAAADWRSLAAHRLDPHCEEPGAAVWTEALAHLDGCPACRRAALAADPTLVFRQLRQGVPIASESEEIAAVRQAVAALRSASRVGAAPAGRGLGFGSGPLPAAWPRWAAAAVLAVAGLAAGSAGPDRPPAALAGTLAGTLAEINPAVALAPAPLAVSGPVFAALPVAVGSLRPAPMPMLEELNRPDARVYQLDGGSLSVVMIVDEGLDV